MPAGRATVRSTSFASPARRGRSRRSHLPGESRSTRDLLADTRASAVISASVLPTPRAPCCARPNPTSTFARALGVLTRPSGLRGGSPDRCGRGGRARRAGRVRRAVRPRGPRRPHRDRGASSTPSANSERGRASDRTVVMHSHVAIRERVTLGNRVVLQNGVVIGGDGFGFATTAAGAHEKIPHLGTVVIEDDVEIGANTTVDRPARGRDPRRCRNQDRQPRAGRARREDRPPCAAGLAGRYLGQHDAR